MCPDLRDRPADNQVKEILIEGGIMPCCRKPAAEKAAPKKKKKKVTAKKKTKK